MMESTQMLTKRFEDLREIKNLLGKYVSSLLLKREGYVLADFWSNREDVCLGLNSGYYKGREAVDGYFQAVGRKTELQGKLLQKAFPKQLGELTEKELYGVGPFEAKPLTSPVVRIAGDGESAKGMWMVQGSNTDVRACGPVTYWTWGVYCVDFIKEDGQWKLWHVLYLEDINHASGQDWTKPEIPYPDLPEFEPLKEFSIPEPNVKQTVREYYTPDRPFTSLPPLPVQYEAFADTFSYGI